MGSAQEAYRVMLRDDIAPALRGLGFKGSGRHYRLDDDCCWARLGFQASQYNTFDEVRFTINLAVAQKATWERMRQQRPQLPKEPSPGVYYGTFGWWQRIGDVLPDGRDVWWIVTDRQSVTVIADEVVTAVRDFGLPAMRAQREPLST